ncbi:MAG: DNA mismatch endonuclease Vsr [Deltaproteobacteria bacterium]|nr:DNA mismatch endonuclease Vsr [Deltaproteobacteria bacterium]
MDTLTPLERSERMSRVKSRDTKPEKAVRSLLHSLGYRYRLQGKDLPGRPDLLFRSRRKVVFVHGCFWHRHRGCALARLPKSRLNFWLPKLESNAMRDRTAQSRLRKMGWNYLVVWECQIGDREKLSKRLIEFLS